MLTSVSRRPSNSSLLLRLPLPPPPPPGALSPQAERARGADKDALLSYKLKVGEKLHGILAQQPAERAVLL